MQTSEMLKIPPSSLRRYSSYFASYLSPQSPGRKRSYTDSDIVILGKIKELTRKLPLDQIGPRLPLVEEPPPPENSLALIPGIAREFERIDTGLSSLRASWEEDHKRLEKITAWARLPWWRKLFTSPPE